MKGLGLVDEKIVLSTNIYLILTCRFVNARQACRRVRFPRKNTVAIVRILTDLPQVADTVVAPVAVDMVDHLGKPLVMQHPYDMVHLDVHPNPSSSDPYITIHIALAVEKSTDYLSVTAIANHAGLGIVDLFLPDPGDEDFIAHSATTSVHEKSINWSFTSPKT